MEILLFVANAPRHPSNENITAIKRKIRSTSFRKLLLIAYVIGNADVIKLEGRNMKSQIMSPQSHLSHISARVSGLYERFRLMPFQFFGEKEIHSEFYKELNDLRRTDSRYAKMRIIREFPTSYLFEKGENGILKESSRGRRAYIDVLVKHPSGNVGFEFYFGKQTIPTEKNYYQDIFFLRNRSLSPKKALIHTQNDCIKLKSERDLLFSWTILFIASYHEDLNSMNYFIENKREKIIQGLTKMKKDMPNNIRILYIEKSYIGDLNSKGEWHQWQSG